MERRLLPTTRLSDLKGALAVMVLEARARDDGAIEVVVELPFVSAKTSREANEFMKRVAPDVRFRLEGRAASGVETPGQTSAKRATRKGTSETFTDLNQWLLKYLLLAPNREHPRSLRGLAAATESSLPSAQRFVDTFAELGHVVRGSRGFEVVRRDELMRLWFASMELTRDWRIPVRSRYGAARLLEALAVKVSRGEASAALGGFAACDARGMLHVVESGPVEVHADRRAMAIVWDHAERVERRDADALIVPSAAYAASIFRPLRWDPEMRGPGTLHPVDVVQSALDVWSLPALGGREQARYIVENVLKWSDGD